MTPNMERGARIIIHEWVKVRAWDKVLIVTSKEYLAEAKAMEKEASGKARSVNTLLVENKGRHVGIFFDDNEAVFDPYTAIIAATEYSLVTTKAAKRAIQRHKKFLSLPLATNDGRSFLEYAIGMVLFTMIMGNAFAAITVMTVGIGAPFVLAYGANPVVIGMLALTCGYCGTLLTPMAANFNILPVAILNMKDRWGAIKNQVLVAIFMLVFQICYMIVLK